MKNAQVTLKPYLAWVVNCPECGEPVYITHDPPPEPKGIWKLSCGSCWHPLSVTLEIDND